MVGEREDSICGDYTLWRRQIYDNMSIEDIIEMLRDDFEDNPFERKCNG